MPLKFRYTIRNSFSHRTHQGPIKTKLNSIRVRQHIFPYLAIITPESVTISNIQRKPKNNNQKQSNSSSILYKKITIQIVPTVPHCHLTQQIGLLIRYQLENQLLNSQLYKIHIKCKDGTHNDQKQVEKQINDKERVQAAMEKPQIKQFLQRLCKIQ